MPPEFTLCVLGFVFIILVTIVILVLRSKGDPLSDFTPEQRKALHLQNNVLTFGLLALFIPSLFGAIVSHLAGIDMYSEEIKNLSKIYVFFLLAGCATIIGLSSIVSQASIIPPRRYSKEFSKGGQAINGGLMLLLIVVVAFLAWFGR